MISQYLRDVAGYSANFW